MVQMAPIWFYSLASSIPVKREVLNDAAARALRFQWRNPADILSVLLLLGPEILKNRGTLMPAPDVDGVMVVGADSTHLRNSSS
ncbi:hypothetical protein CGCA056_v013523 [Colletotrichum aenigma]|uniref:uncharacterized protein n=1 Tax=Colletotrichum aenigma TaxID=1215731 RepID=UPI001872D490|nr:uncharacterized protein CGCA056_v013523 [Colletotrichum aenigma]KAF5507017.1 hypothetical protein CGCA056_v013523 [Colletotrichum aenigma]